LPQNNFRHEDEKTGDDGDHVDVEDALEVAEGELGLVLRVLAALRLLLKVRIV
jgi:hypothetical protein